LRHTPEIKFQFDPSVEYALHLEEVIHHLHEEEQKRHADD
jgi:ribosome-binding factor A